MNYASRACVPKLVALRIRNVGPAAFNSLALEYYRH